jgi:hypothetical protein
VFSFSKNTTCLLLPAYRNHCSKSLIQLRVYFRKTESELR